MKEIQRSTAMCQHIKQASEFKFLILTRQPRKYLEKIRPHDISVTRAHGSTVIVMPQHKS